MINKFSRFNHFFSGHFNFNNFGRNIFGRRIVRGLSFDGVDDQVSMGDVLNPGTNDYTIALRLYILGKFGTTQYLFSKGAAAPTASGYSLIYNGANNWIFRIGNGVSGGGVGVDNSANRNPLFLHAGMVINQSGGQLAGYINGAVAATIAITAVTNITNTVPFLLGNSTTPNPANIHLMEAKIWATKALSSSEMLTTCNGGTVSGVTTEWNFNNLIGTTLVDTVGAVNGTIAGAQQLVVSNPPIFND